MARRAHGVQPRKAAAGNLQSLLNDAVGAFQSGEDERVIATCRQLLAKLPGQPDALNLLGIACHRRGHTDDAVAALSQAAKAAPRNADIHNNLGVVLASLARHAEAAASFETAARLSPRDHQIRANLGRAFAALERWGKAAEQFGLARRGDPRDVDLLVDMARACGMAGDIAEAERCCRAAIEAAPARPGPHKELAVILRKGGRRDEALAQIEFALAAQPETPRLHVDRGLLLSELARYDDAVAAFDRALALDPDFADARYGRALVNLLLGFCVGIVEKRRIIDGRRVQPGDEVLGLGSSGIHSNGYALVRKALARLPKSGKLPVDLGEPLVDAVLRPTRIYVKSILNLLKRYRRKRVVRAMAHITGSGLPGNVPRVIPDDCDVVLRKGSWPIPPVFKLLERLGVEEAEMFDVFNMGIGFVIVVAPSFADSAQAQLERSGEKVYRIGAIREGKGELTWA